MISCLCITEDRAAFMPWLLWGYGRQTHADKELIVVDSSETPFDFPEGVRVIRVPHRTNVPTKRNIAMAAAGDLFAWFDDDDWQHPERLESTAANIRDADFVGGDRAWFLDLYRGGCAYHTERNRALFNGALFRKTQVVFDETKRVASDTRWVNELRKAGMRERALKRVLFCWLSHEWNLSNPVGRRTLSQNLADVAQAVGSPAWGDTSRQLAALRTRLGPPRKG